MVYIISALPILCLLVCLLLLKLSGQKASAVSFLSVTAIYLFYFKSGSGIMISMAKGFGLGSFVVLIIWGAMFLYNLVEKAGALEVISETVGRSVEDKLIQLLFLSWIFASFLQGIAGFGVPVIVVVPILISLGFSPETAAAAVLIGHSWSISFGSMGSSVYAIDLVTKTNLNDIVLNMSILGTISMLCTGISICILFGGRNVLQRGIVYVFTVSVFMGATLFVMAKLQMYSILGLAAGVVGSIAMFIICRIDNKISMKYEAIEKGLKELNVSRKMVDVKVLENGEKRSFFSILAPRVVKVELTLKEQANEEAAHEEKKPAEPRKAMGFIAVSIGAGMNEIFKELGADYIIEGGQTMNPSTEDMLNAIDRVNADTVFILPNNKNIVLAANQAKSLVEEKEIIVIPTKTVPQGITAIINFMPDADAKTNEEAMLEEIKNVKTGQVTYAVRDTHIDDKEIHEGDIMGIGDSGILAVGKDLEETTKELIANLVDEDSELISIYYGEEVSEEDAEKFTEEITELYPDVDVDIQFGGQPIYYYVLAVE